MKSQSNEYRSAYLILTVFLEVSRALYRVKVVLTNSGTLQVMFNESITFTDAHEARKTFNAFCEMGAVIASMDPEVNGVEAQEVQEPDTDVALLASGYDWDCPHCLRPNHVSEKQESVTCAYCRRTFDVEDHVHPTG